MVRNNVKFYQNSTHSQSGYNADSRTFNAQSENLTHDRIEQQKDRIIIKKSEDLIPIQLHDNNLVEFGY